MVVVVGMKHALKEILRKKRRKHRDLSANEDCDGRFKDVGDKLMEVERQQEHLMLSSTKQKSEEKRATKERRAPHIISPLKTPEKVTCPIEIQAGETGILRGMKKWLADYYSKRPGLHVLQRQTDSFIAEFETQEEQARREREAAAAEDGWTVVAHHKGRRKTTELETGVKVGGVAASVAERSVKKSKKALLDFYRFQGREARRHEVLQLQRRFEEDKKRIAKLKAARKFRPY